MKPIPLRIVDAPLPLASDQEKPTIVQTITLKNLCKTAGIPCTVTQGAPPKILLCRGSVHRSAPGHRYVGLDAVSPRFRKMTRTAALRVLEILAFGFFDYGARECVCGRRLFVAAP